MSSIGSGMLFISLIGKFWLICTFSEWSLANCSSNRIASSANVSPSAELHIFSAEPKVTSPLEVNFRCDRGEEIGQGQWFYTIRDHHKCVLNVVLLVFVFVVFSRYPAGLRLSDVFFLDIFFWFPFVFTSYISYSLFEHELHSVSSYFFVLSRDSSGFNEFLGFFRWIWPGSTRFDLVTVFLLVLHDSKYFIGSTEFFPTDWRPAMSALAFVWVKTGS